MSGIVGGSNNRGSGLIADLGTDGQVMTSAGLGLRQIYEEAAAGGDLASYIIDGDFTQWPEGTAATTMANSKYTSALWVNNQNGAGVGSWERSTDVPTLAQSGHQSAYSLLLKCTTADTSVASTDRLRITEYITGSDYAALHNQQVTVSFFCKTSSENSGDTYCLGFQNSAGDRNYLTDFTATSSWTKVTKTLTLDSTGTWLFTESDRGLAVLIGLWAGSTFQGSADTWQAGNLWGTSSTSNFFDHTSNEFYISQFQLVLGSTAPTFKSPSIATVKDQVDWYVQRYDYDDVSGQGAQVGQITATSTAMAIHTFRNPIRGAATITAAASGGGFRLYDGSASADLTAIAGSGAGKFNAWLEFTQGGTTWTVGRAGHLNRIGTNTCWVMYDARH